MRAFFHLYLATVREFTRDVTALFWTLAFPIMFILIFGMIFSRSDTISFDIGLVNEDGAASAQLVSSFQQIEAFKIHLGTQDDEVKALKDGDRKAVIVIPAGTGQTLASYVTGTAAGTTVSVPAGTGATSALLDVYYDPADQSTSQIVLNIVDKVIAGMNEGITGTPPALGYQSLTVRSNDLRYIDFLLPGILAMSLMQLGLFGTAAPLVSLREKGVLRRMGATPLSRTTLLTSQVAFRLTLGLVQTVLILVVGKLVFDVHIAGHNLLAGLGMVLLGATTFITLGYFLSGIAKTEEAVQGLISLPNFIFMFLSGVFFPLETMPNWIRPLVDVIPLTYLSDGLRATLIDAGSVFSMTRNVGILAAWLVVCGILAVRVFRWEPQA